MNRCHRCGSMTHSTDIRGRALCGQCDPLQWPLSPGIVSEQEEPCRPTDDDLRSKSGSAWAQLVRCGGWFRHCRSERPYRVVGVSLRESDLELLVQYAPHAGSSIHPPLETDGPTFSCSLTEFELRFEPWFGDEPSTPLGVEPGPQVDAFRRSRIAVVFDEQLASGRGIHAAHASAVALALRATLNMSVAERIELAQSLDGGHE